jgi:hypothetical protein
LDNIRHDSPKNASRTLDRNIRVPVHPPYGIGARRN